MMRTMFLQEVKMRPCVSTEKTFVNKSLKATKAKSHGTHLLNELNRLMH